MKKLIVETRGLMIYKYEEIKMISIKNGMGDISILTPSPLCYFLSQFLETYY